MTRPFILLAFCLLAVTTVRAQSALVVMNQTVNVGYTNVRLVDALQRISDRFGLYFSYSADLVPVNRRVSLRSRPRKLSRVLQELFDQVGVDHARIGNQIVLKKRKRSIPENDPDEEAPEEDTMNKDYGYEPPKQSKPEEMYTSSRYTIGEATKPISSQQTPLLVAQRAPREDSLMVTLIVPTEIEEEEEEQNSWPGYDGPAAQISIVPRLSLNTPRNNGSKGNNVSLNILGGRNKAVNGVEIGGLFNQVDEDVRGVQLAGLFNIAGGDLGPSRWIDEVGVETSHGVQMSGLFNMANEVNGVQISGLFNYAGADVEGVQITGLTNIVRGSSGGAQIAGLVNINRGDSEVQLAGLANIARDVDGSQVSTLYNKARRVSGAQVGLINICDTVANGTYGLLNIVRQGYNYFEFGGGDAIHLNAQFKFGSRQFYNIVHFGKRVDDRTWSLGLGFGTALRHTPGRMINLEVISQQVNEDEFWTTELSLLNQFRAIVSQRTGRGYFYWGPVLNAMVSQRQDAEGQIRSGIAPYTIFDNAKLNIDHNTHVTIWLGFNAGFRF